MSELVPVSVLLATPAFGADLSNDADTFYRSDAVAVERVTDAQYGRP